MKAHRQPNDAESHGVQSALENTVRVDFIGIKHASSICCSSLLCCMRDIDGSWPEQVIKHVGRVYANIRRAAEKASATN